ncbi:MAG: hypothetical protein J0G28_10430 [Afipia sp.]|nr:hypothetical protein [Afipia sp.]
MRKLMIATCCAALMAAVSAGTVSAQTTSPSGQNTMKTDSTANTHSQVHKKKTAKKTNKTKKMHSSMRRSNSGTVGMSPPPARERLNRSGPAPSVFEPANRGPQWTAPDVPGAPAMPGSY